MQQLEADYQRLETAVARASPHITVSDHSSSLKPEEERWRDDSTATAEPFLSTVPPAAELTSAYAQLTQLKEKLRRENIVLSEAASEHDKFQSQLGLRLEAEKVGINFVASVFILKYQTDLLTRDTFV